MTKNPVKTRGEEVTVLMNQIGLQKIQQLAKLIPFPEEVHNAIGYVFELNKDISLSEFESIASNSSYRSFIERLSFNAEQAVTRLENREYKSIQQYSKGLDVEFFLNTVLENTKVEVIMQSLKMTVGPQEVYPLQHTLTSIYLSDKKDKYQYLKRIKKLLLQCQDVLFIRKDEQEFLRNLAHDQINKLSFSLIDDIKKSIDPNEKKTVEEKIEEMFVEKKIPSSLVGRLFSMDELFYIAGYKKTGNDSIDDNSIYLRYIEYQMFNKEHNNLLGKKSSIDRLSQFKKNKKDYNSIINRSKAYHAGNILLRENEQEPVDYSQNVEITSDSKTFMNYFAITVDALVA